MKNQFEIKEEQDIIQVAIAKIKSKMFQEIGNIEEKMASTKDEEKKKNLLIRLNNLKS